MSIDITFPYTNPSNYIFDSNLITIGGTAVLKPLDNSGQNFAQDFANDTGFTYDNTKAEFVGGQVQQKDTRPTNATFYADFGTDENGNWGDGVLTGTLAGSASVDSGFLKFTNILGDGCDWSAVSNADSQQVGCIRLSLQPQYTGNPASSQVFITTTRADNDTRNLIALVHTGAGQFRVALNDQAGANFTIDLGIWAPISGVSYEIELNYDFTTGSTRLFIDGNQFGATILSTFTRDSNIALLRSGDGVTADQTPNFWISDFLIFDAVQHTANYTPGTFANSTIYLTNKVDLPQFSYSGVGNIQSFDSFVTIQSGSPRFVLNSLYWNGASWVSSDDSYAQSNSAADVNINISSLPALDTLDISIIFDDTNTQGAVDNLITTYTGQIYSTADPTVETNTSFTNDELINFVEVSVIIGNDNIKHILSKDGVWYYWDGLVWAVSNETYAQSNTAAEIVANITSFTTTNVTTKLRSFLHSDDGSTTPTLDSVTITYDFAGTTDDISKCIVWANNYLNGGVSTDSIKIYLERDAAKYKNTTVVRQKEFTVTPDAQGQWEFGLIETDNMEDNPRYVFEFINIDDISESQKYKGNVPDQTSANFWDLPNLERLE